LTVYGASHKTRKLGDDCAGARQICAIGKVRITPSNKIDFVVSRHLFANELVECKWLSLTPDTANDYWRCALHLKDVLTIEIKLRKK